MSGKQLSLFDDWKPIDLEEDGEGLERIGIFDKCKMIVSALAAGAIARSLGNPKLVRQLNLAQNYLNERIVKDAPVYHF